MFVIDSSARFHRRLEHFVHVVDVARAVVIVYAVFDSNHGRQDLYNPDLRVGGMIDKALVRAARIRLELRKAARRAQAQAQMQAQAAARDAA